MSWDLFFDALRNSVLITGLVIVMMLMIEYINVQSHGKWFEKLQGSKTKQVILGSCLGIVPGCIGGFAAVSLYTHRLISFGALIAMMIASSGDEAFVLLAMIPKDAIILFTILFVIAIITGLVVDRFSKKKINNIYTKEHKSNFLCDKNFEIHTNEILSNGSYGSVNNTKPSLKNLLHPGKERILLLIGVTAFIVALAFGLLEHEHAGHVTEKAGAYVNAHENGHIGNFNILNEYWLNLIFAILSLFTLYFVATSSKHFIKEHLWNHVIKKHLLSIFCWTFGALLIIQIGLHYFDIETWTKSNIPFMIVLAVLIGIVPESGPHMIFITLFAGGYIPFSVLLASSISQDGHTTLPLLAESKKSFLKAKLINVMVGLIVGFTFHAFGI
ncbi:MAG: putative manganese transporter [Bacteroidales bacterium]|jgi:hypothetical protein